jgi:branched-chain amino acid transport system ATP-binding protein
MTGAMLSAEGLHAGYGDIKVLRGIDLAVEPGKVTAVLGANGAGKTTLLSAIAGIVPLTAGVVRLGATEISHLPARSRARLGLAMVQEGKRVFRRRTVRENLLLGGAWLPKAQRLAGVQRSTELFPILEEMSHLGASTLSGGQQQMLAIGQALVPAPDVIMLDEPSAGLAPVIVKSVWEAIERLRDAGKAILLVEQLVPQTLGLADRILVLDRGQVVIDQDADEVSDADVRSIYLRGGRGQVDRR